MDSTSERQGSVACTEKVTVIFENSWPCNLTYGDDEVYWFRRFWSGAEIPSEIRLTKSGILCATRKRSAFLNPWQGVEFI